MQGEREKEHTTRTLLSEYIVEHPGVSFNMLKHVLGINDSTLRYHLNYLQSEKRIYSKKKGGLRCYFSSIVSSMTLKRTREGRTGSRNRQRVLTMIRENPGLTRKDLKSSFGGITTKGMSYIISRLKEEGLIWEFRTEEGNSYEAVTREKLMDQMLVTLARKLLNGQIDETTFIELKRQIEEDEME